MLDILRKIGPHSKQILNYSFPPLLYQRGEEDEDEEDSGEEQDAEDGDDADEDAEMMIDGQEELTAVDDAQLGVDDDEEEPDDTHNSHMLGDSDDMELPQLHNSDDEELMALEDQLHSH